MRSRIATIRAVRLLFLLPPERGISLLRNRPCPSIWTLTSDHIPARERPYADSDASIFRPNPMKYRPGTDKLICAHMSFPTLFIPIFAALIITKTECQSCKYK